MTRWEGAAYVALAVGGAVIGQLAIDLGAGRIPTAAWLTPYVPAIVAGLIALTVFLPKVGKDR